MTSLQAGGLPIPGPLSANQGDQKAFIIHMEVIMKAFYQGLALKAASIINMGAVFRGACPRDRAR